MEKLIIKIQEIVESLNYYLYEVEYVEERGAYVLRVMIENDGYIDIDDCIKVSRALSEYLDQDDPFAEPYNLEVTSPGAERELKTTEQIERAVSKYVYIETMEQKQYGELLSYKNGILTLKLKNTKTLKIDDIEVSLIRLAIKF
jgi:ribosome maturation factor RimP